MMDKKDVYTKMTLSNNESMEVMNSFMQIISETFTEETNNYILLRNDWQKKAQKLVELNIIHNHKVEFSEQDTNKF